jgi:zinc D-Ala-D-Ala dipeptidase
MLKNNFKIILFLVLSISCKSQKNIKSISDFHKETQKIAAYEKKNTEIDDSTFVNLKDYSNDFVYDLKYATTDNFLKVKVYDCPECFLRLKTVKALLNANSEFMKLGFKIKLFDCYRPLDVQKKMWEIVPNPNYVANPTKGSRHNRGAAVDITLVDFQDNELEMGTEFDFFGEKAGHNYIDLSAKILENRKFLKSRMEMANFNALNSEWWHYDFADGLTNKVSNQKWKCE